MKNWLSVTLSLFWAGIVLMSVDFLVSAILHIGYQIQSLGVVGFIFMIIGLVASIVLCIYEQKQDKNKK